MPLRLRPYTASERELHLSCLDVARVALPARALVLHYPSGMEASPAAWNRMLGLGAVAGFPDLAVLLDGRLYTAEIKREHGAELASQQELAPRLAAAGVPRAVVRSPEEFYALLDQYGLPIRRVAGLGVRRSEPLHPAYRPLQGEWAAAFQEAVRCWRHFLESMPPRHVVMLELAGAENALRSLALDATAREEVADAPAS